MSTGTVAHMEHEMKSSAAQLEREIKLVDQLTARRTRIQVQLEAGRQQYNQVVEEARALFRTENISELQQLWKQHEAENAKEVAMYQQARIEFERGVKQLEDALANPELLAAMIAAMPPLNPQPETAPVEASQFSDEDI